MKGVRDFESRHLDACRRESGGDEINGPACTGDDGVVRPIQRRNRNEVTIGRNRLGDSGFIGGHGDHGAIRRQRLHQATPFGNQA